ncbi:16S rRNA (cytidine(1402)-2'-O)-methyltransferase [Candidatus Auribacterota bacterium]
MKSGILYIVGTPIGNLEDITLRALRILKSVDLIACEDTRHTQKLLNHYNIPTPSESYHKFSEKSKCDHFIHILKNGRDIALVSDSGMPGISDPGAVLIKEAIRSSIAVVPIPGPSAFLTALAVSGFDLERFIYEGFLPHKKMAKKKKLLNVKDDPGTIVFYESPQRIVETLECIDEVLGNIEIVIARELTKFYEEVMRGKVRDVLSGVQKTDIKGEIALVIKVEPSKGPEKVDIEKEIKEAMKKLNLTKKEAIIFVAKRYNLKKKDVYNKTIAKN